MFGLYSTAQGYVRTTTDDGHNVQWTQACVHTGIDLQVPPGLTLEDVDRTLRQSLSNWSLGTKDCSALALSARNPTSVRARPDRQNVVLFLQESWRRGDLVYDPSAVAVTTLTYARRPGQQDHGAVLDADIELNAVGFRFVPGTENAQDLENTLTHELGHVLGLSHNCQEQRAPHISVDQHGNPVPPCLGGDDTQETQALKAATMYPYATSGETTKRSVGPDEIRALCEIYPKGKTLAPCEQTIYGGCMSKDMGQTASLQTSAPPKISLVNLALVFLAGSLLWPRRKVART